MRTFDAQLELPGHLRWAAASPGFRSGTPRGRPSVLLGVPEPAAKNQGTASRPLRHKNEGTKPECYRKQTTGLRRGTPRGRPSVVPVVPWAGR